MKPRRPNKALALIFCLFAGAAGAVSAADSAPAVGATAPDFTLMGSDGQQHTLADYRGKAVVLAWFPKAFTGG